MSISVMSFREDPDAVVAAWFSYDNGGLFRMELAANAAGFRLLADHMLAFAERAEAARSDDSIGEHALHLDQHNWFTDLSTGELVVWCPPGGTPTDDWVLGLSLSPKERAVLLSLSGGPVPRTQLPSLPMMGSPMDLDDVLTILRGKGLVTLAVRKEREEVELTSFGQRLFDRLRQ